MENQTNSENNMNYDLTIENFKDFIPKIESFFKYNKQLLWTSLYAAQKKPIVHAC